MSVEFFIVFICSILSLLYGGFTIKKILEEPQGSDRMKEIASAIQEGAQAYLNRQYITISIVGVLIAVILFYLMENPFVSVGFVIGAFLSGLAGYIGMFVSVRANVRTTEAATQSLEKALDISFKSGAITGFLVVGLGLLGLISYYFFLQYFTSLDGRKIIEGMVALSFGASLISIFARLGGGIFTKGADVGADLVGKIEAGIPEDDPRNPAVIADNVGDNVGDCAGMAADLFETYAVTIVGTMVLGLILFQGSDQQVFMMYPLLIAGVCIISSLVGAYYVKLGESQSIMGALYKGLIITALGSVILIYIGTEYLIGMDKVIVNSDLFIESFFGIDLFYCSLVGLTVTGLIVWITEYYTSTEFSPVKSVANSSQSGHATNIIQGLAVSMQSTALPTIVIILGIIFSYKFAGLYGISIAATTMLALAGMIVALDAYGPVTDNAGGIAEMSNLPESVRKTTDALDAVGNTTKDGGKNVLHNSYYSWYDKRNVAYDDKLTWKYNSRTPCTYRSQTRVAEYYNGNFWFVNAQGQLCKLNETTGKITYSKNLGSSSGWWGGELHGQYLYVFGKGRIRIFDLAASDPGSSSSSKLCSFLFIYNIYLRYVNFEDFLYILF